MELLLCCFGTDLPGRSGTIGATGHRRRSADTRFTELDIISGARERPGSTRLYGSHAAGKSATDYEVHTASFYWQDANRAYATHAFGSLREFAGGVPKL